MRILTIAGAIACLALIGVGSVQAQQGPPAVAAKPAAAPSPAASPDQSYILGPADVIEVSVLGRTDYVFRDRIASDGTIQLQFLGVVPAGGRTIEQLSDQVAQALDKGGFFTHPVIKVDIVSYASRYVVVLGNVRTPGLVPVDRAYHLSEMIARVGGVTEAGAAYVILRPQHGPERRLNVAMLATGDADEDPLVAPGDKIYSPAADVFYISGQIKSPGAFGILPDMTVRMALARAGGVTDSGNERGVSLTRAGKKIAHVDLDGKVAPGDVMVVPERLF